MNHQPTTVQQIHESGALRPDVRAAVVVAVPVILLEVLTDLIPVFGLLISLPLSIGVYLVQGILVSRYARSDPQHAAASYSQVAGLAARSALWTGLFISPLTAVTTMLVGGSMTAGILFLWVPGVLLGTLVDLLVNLVFALLGSWTGYRSTGQQAAANSCLGVALGIGITWILVAALTVAAILYAIQFLPHG